MVNSTIRQVHLYTVYDGPKSVSGELTWTLFHIDGRILEQGSKKTSLRYGESRLVKTLDFQKAMKTHGARHLYLRIRLESECGEISQDTIFLTAPRLINLPRGPITSQIKAISEREFEITFASKVLQYQAEFSIPRIAHQTDDNFFDLYPDEPYSVRLHTTESVTKTQIGKALQVHSLVDTY